MRKRYDFFIDVAQFPLIVLFIAIMLLGIGNLLINPNVAIFWMVTNPYSIAASSFLRMVGGSIIAMLPLTLLVALVSKRFDDVLATTIAVISFFIFTITTMFFTSAKLPALAYASILGIGVDTLNTALLSGVVKLPLQIGLLSSFVCFYVTKVSYSRTRNRKTYGLFSFIDKNSLALLLSIIYSILAGLVVSYAWPYVVEAVYTIFTFIADDITNPFNLFLYGASEKLLSVLNLGNLARNTFWFTDLGGSWLDSVGRNFVGDVSIWTAQAMSGSMASGIGRFITPLYIVNIFAIPGYLIAIFTLISNRFEKRKYFTFILIAIIASVFCGNSLPFDLFMLAASPMLFLIHVFISSLLYATLQWAKIFIGYSYVGSTLFASPGSFADLLVYIKSPTMLGKMLTVLIVGLVIGIIYFVLTKVYYHYLAIDIFQSGKEKILLEQLISCLGGIENIKVIDANVIKLLVQVKNDQLVDIMKLRKLCFSKVFESKTGYVLYFYKASPKLQYSIKQLIKHRG